MQVPTWSVFVAGELILMFAGLTVLLFFMLMRSDAKWKKLVDKAKTRISELKAIEGQYEQAKENLHRYMKGFAHLKEQLEEAKNNPELQQRVDELEIELKALQPLKLQVEELQGERDALQAQLAAPPDAQGSDVDALRQQLLELQKENETLRGGGVEIVDSPAENGDGIDLWGDAPETLDRAGDGSIKHYDNNMEDWHKKHREEIEQLREKTSEQRCLIFELRTEMAKAANGGDEAAGRGLEQLQGLERMLQESETCIQVLEDELKVVQEQVSAYQTKIAELEAAPAPAAGEAGNGEELAQLQAQLEGANQMVMTMMKANGDQSNVIGFARSSIACRTLEELADSVLGVVGNFGLKAALQIKSDGGNVNRSSDGAVDPADLACLSDASSEERYEENGDQLKIRFEKLTLLVKGMPEDDADSFGRFRDSLAIAMELAVAEIENIEAEYQQQQQQQVLKKIINSTRKTLRDVEAQFQYQAKESKDIMDSLSYVMDNESFSAAMEPAFQQVFKDIMKDSKVRFDELYDKGLAVDKSFSTIIESLDQRIH